MTRALLLLPLVALSACVETARPRAYACSPDAGEIAAQCPGGWICGLEGYCRDPSVEGAFRCERDSGFGCAEGWFCTVEGTCRSRDAGGPFPCTRQNPEGDPRDGGVPNDCGNSAWWCGASGQCQPVGVPDDYPCNVDNDCEAAWRCSPEGRCIEVPADSRFGNFDGGAAQLVSPLFGTPNAAHVAVGPPFEPRDPSKPDAGIRSVSTVGVAMPDGALIGLIREYPTTESAGTGKLHLVSVPFAVPGVRGLGLSDCRVYAVREGSDGGWTFDVMPVGSQQDGGVVVRPLEQIIPVPAGTRLRTANRTLAPAAIFSDTQWAWHEPWAPLFIPLDCGARNITQLMPLPGVSAANGTRARDMAWLGSPAWFSGTSGFVLSTDEGLFIIEDRGFNALSQNEWRALGGPYAPNGVCGPKGQGYRVINDKVRALYSNILAAEQTVVAPDGGSWHGISVFFVPETPFQGWGQTFPDGGELFPHVLSDGGCTNEAWNLYPLFPPCEPCSAEFPHLVDYTPFIFEDLPDGGDRVVIEGRCSSGDGGTGPQQAFTLTDHTALGRTACARVVGKTFPAGSTFISGTSNSQRIAHVDITRGTISAGDGEKFSLPMLMDRPPQALFRDTDAGEWLLLADDFIAFHQPQAGFLPLVIPQGGLPTFTEVDGRSDWTVLEDGVLQLIKVNPDFDVTPVASPPVSGNIRQLPVRATVVKTSTGAAELLVSSFDTVYSADVSGVVDGGGRYGALEYRIIPFQRAAIEMLAASTPEPSSGLFARAYAKTAAGVFELRAESRSRWRAVDVELPGDPIAVFSDGEHARAGFDDGRVYSLPTRLLLAPSLPQASLPAVGFVSVCGQPFALSRGGVFKAQASNGALGSWVQVPIDQAAPPHLRATSPDLFEGGRLALRGDTLWLFLTDGTSYQLPVSCPNGP